MQTPYHAFFNNLGVPSLLVAGDGTVEDLNDAAREMVGFSGELMIDGETMENIRRGYPDQSGFIVDFRGENFLRVNGDILGVWEEGSRILYLMTIRTPFIVNNSRTRESLRQEEARLAHRIDRTPLLWSVDRNYRYLSFNEAHRREMRRVWGVDIEAGMNILDVLSDPRHRKLVRYNYDRALSGEHFYTVDDLEDGEGNHRYFEKILGPLPDKSGNIMGVSLRTVELTDSEEVKECLSSTIAIQRSLIEGYGNIGVCSLDRFYRYRAFNDAYRRFMEDVRGVKIRIGTSLLDSLSPRQLRREIKHKLDEVLEGGSYTEVRNYALSDGKIRYYENHFLPIRYDDGSIQGITVSCTDVTEQRIQRQELRRALGEKDVLLREVHSRVKNNLQIMGSLINLQRQEVERNGGTGEPLGMLKTLSGRIRAMALAHEQLYQEGSLGAVDMGPFIKRLLVMSAEFTGAESRGITIKEEVEDMTLDLSTALPLGLIVNELSLNSLRHGFPKGRTGMVVMGLRRLSRGSCLLSVSDDGVGFSDSPEGGGADLFGVGLSLVNTLARQLGGEFSCTGGNGTVAEVRFSCPEEED